jgi:hypothetical protein
LHRIHHAGKFGEDVVPWSIHHPASVLLDQIRDDPLIILQGLYSGSLILTHEAAVSHYIGTEDGSKFAFETFCGHETAFDTFEKGWNFKA